MNQMLSGTFNILVDVTIRNLTTMMTVFRRRGIEQTKDMNMPLESKYWKLEKDLPKTVSDINNTDHPHTLLYI